MGLETLDLIQLHCPPTETYDRPEIFELFGTLKKEGKIRNLGVSVEKVDEALKAIEYENVTTVQIIFNMLRQRPSEKFFAEAAKKNVGILARVPLASGLLTGKFSASTTFGKDDHRTFNRNGEAFDKGETFSGVDYMKGLEAVEEIKKLFPQSANLAAVSSEMDLNVPGGQLCHPRCIPSRSGSFKYSGIRIARFIPGTNGCNKTDIRTTYLAGYC